ncbi:MAG: S-methyl thiohydantoin desulfurase domain-containing protein [Methylobacter sp.]
MFNSILEKPSIIDDARVKDFGSGNYQLTKKDISYIVYGACFLGSGGGGPIGLALLFMDKMINDTDLMTYVNPDSLHDNKTVAFVAGLGSPDKIFEGYGQTVSLNAFSEMNIYLAQSGQEPLGYLIPVEMGAMNTLIPFIISAQKGIAVINGDPCGRAAPEMGMNLFNTNSLPINPIILTSDSDSSGHYQKIICRVTDANDAEYQARKFARSNNNTAGLACYPMRGSDLNCSISENRGKYIQWTVGLAWHLGQNIIERKNYHQFLEFLNNFTLNSYTLFEGILTDKQEREINGFDVGKITVTNGNELFFIYYKNESLLAWNVTRKRHMAMGPDSINFLARKDAQPFSNTDINSDPEKNPKNIPLGTAIGIIGLCAYEKLQNAVLVDLFLANIQEILAAFPEDQVPVPNRYISLSDLILKSNQDRPA